MRKILIAVALAAAALAGATSANAQGHIIVVNADGPNEGFNDPTAAAPVAAKPATTVGAQRLFIFRHAAGICETTLHPSVDNLINAQFNPLGVGVLGQAGTTAAFQNFPGAEYPNMWYFASLAKHLAHADINPL